MKQSWTNSASASGTRPASENCIYQPMTMWYGKYRPPLNKPGPSLQIPEMTYKVWTLWGKMLNPTQYMLTPLVWLKLVCITTCKQKLTLALISIWTQSYSESWNSSLSSSDSSLSSVVRCRVRFFCLPVDGLSSAKSLRPVMFDMSLPKRRGGFATTFRNTHKK